MHYLDLSRWNILLLSYIYCSAWIFSIVTEYDESYVVELSIAHNLEHIVVELRKMFMRLVYYLIELPVVAEMSLGDALNLA